MPDTPDKIPVRILNAATIKVEMEGIIYNHRHRVGRTPETYDLYCYDPKDKGMLDDHNFELLADQLPKDWTYHKKVTVTMQLLIHST